MQPASAVLGRARNQLGFHWDPEAIRAALLARTADPVIWVEGSQASTTTALIYRLPAEILPGALLPHLAAAAPEQADAGISEMARHIVDAMDALSTYFVAAIYGYLGEHGGTAHFR